MILANYPRRGGNKKKNQLRQKENSFRGDICRQATRDKLEFSAEKVRVAHLGVIKGLNHEYLPVRNEGDNNCSATLDNLRQAKQYWETISIDEIIEIYSQDSDGDTYVGKKQYWDLRPR